MVSGKIPMRKIVVSSSILAVLVVLLTACESSGEYDSRAVASLDQMSDVIGELSSASYTLDTINASTADLEIRNEHDVYMRGPDKMYVHSVGTQGQKSYWYDGSKLAYFSYTKNVYAIVDAPDGIIKMIDHIHTQYGVDFPAADFFYPDFTDDIMDNYNSLYFAEEEIDGIECVSVVAENDSETVQVWIDKTTYLPHRMIIESKLNSSNFYDVVFSNWVTNQKLPDFLFDFKAPNNSKEIQLQTVN